MIQFFAGGAVGGIPTMLSLPLWCEEMDGRGGMRTLLGRKPRQDPLPVFLRVTIRKKTLPALQIIFPGIFNEDRMRVAFGETCLGNDDCLRLCKQFPGVSCAQIIESGPKASFNLDNKVAH